MAGRHNIIVGAIAQGKAKGKALVEAIAKIEKKYR